MCDPTIRALLHAKHHPVKNYWIKEESTSKLFPGTSARYDGKGHSAQPASPHSEIHAMDVWCFV